MRLDKLTAGDTVDFDTTVAGYPPGDGWTLVYHLVPGPTLAAASPSAPSIQLTAFADGDRYRVQVGPATTEAWAPGLYSWFSDVEKSGARFQVDAGLVTIQPNPATLAVGYDPRSVAAKAVDELTALLATYSGSSGHVEEYEIAGRRMRYANKADILVLLNYWQAILDDERAADRLSKGLPSRRQVLTRFLRV